MSTAQVFRLPDLGEGLTEAEVVAWHVVVGDEVGVDQEVVTVETAKASVDVPCPYAGAVAELHAEPGTVLAVGSPLITIAGGDAAGEQYRSEERAGAQVPQGDPGAQDSPERPLIGYGAGAGPERRRRGGRRGGAAAAQTPAPPGPPSVAGRAAVRVISPLVRRLASEWGIDLTSVQPGPTGVVRRADLEAARQERSGGSGTPDGTAYRAGGAGDVRVPIQGVSKVMVERLSRSRREIPDATTWVDVDATRLMRTKDALKQARPDAGIGVLPLLARIVVAGLRRYPALNSSVDLDAGEVVHHGRVNLGFAAQSPRGLVVPVVHGASEMSTPELAAALRELTSAAREGSLSPAQMSGGTFTLNNYGVHGVDGSTPIINHPETGMLGVGRIVDKPWVHKGRLRVRKVTQLSFTFDHRVCDGGTAGGFLRFVADCVEEPATLLTEV
ncbi:dihydrolipoamide acetyltransferase family protein [Ornithinimicrobium cerasi]|uniref:dihydrolipoamide acetyltransferase family protein n=1 Tax=Ornithinimicrobium cerasi TaxID=2248773 RepID=UPI000F008A6D|nr:dihydrolipoamide acetyltransferase family protein [Ornithinimicrobium cerasi]